MTNEEKARAYDVALEQAKKELNTCGSMDCDAARQIFRFFPQLRESEDERIRKCIGMALTDVDEQRFKDFGVTLKDRLAYLEKQKEQKPVVTHGETYRVDTLGTQQVIAGKMPQKPAEWSEEDEDMLNSCISSIEEAKENRYAYKETDGDTSYDHEIAWLKSLRSRVGKEFLQPHWEPSEEQMKTLYSALNDANDAISLYSNKVFPLYGEISRKRFDALESLYNDLKKLM